MSAIADMTDQVDVQDFFANFLEQCGIVTQYTMPETHRQNDVAERRNHTLKDIVRSMIAHTTLPESLWSEALKIIVYLLNKLPNKTVTKTHMSYGLKNLPTLGIYMFGVVQRKLGHIYHMRRSWMISK